MRLGSVWIQEGDRDMTWTRDRCDPLSIRGLCVAAAPLGLSMAHAQGFGPDPFRPFNSQYVQYVYPIRPETGGAACPGAA